MRAAILSIGDEIVLGQTLDTNGRWLAARLVAGGVRPEEHRTVMDDRVAIGRALRELARDRDLVLVTGGLGPTEDDLTRVAIGDVVDPGQELVEDADARRRLERWFAGRDAPMPPANLVQARRPVSSTCLANPHGTAPGLEARLGACRLVAMPGPPREMKPMFERVVAPSLEDGAGNVLTAVVRLVGLGESDAAQRLGALMARDRDPLVGTTASGGLLAARVRTERRGPDDDAMARLEATLTDVETAWAPYAFGRDDDTLARAVLRELVARGATVAVAESCTGGALAKCIVDEDGASAAFEGGWVTYSNAMKQSCLDVPADILARYGAVSPETACAMAEGARIRAGSTVALSTTGIAGPDGGTEDKPVGTVHVGLARTGTEPVARHFRFRGDRGDVRDRTVLVALQMLRLALIDAPDVHLLWERPRVDSA